MEAGKYLILLLLTAEKELGMVCQEFKLWDWNFLMPVNLHMMQHHLLIYSKKWCSGLQIV